MKKSTILKLALVVTLFSSSVFAQSSKMAVAFSKSIEQEKKLDYSGAIETMKSLNDSTSYEVNLRMGWLLYKAGYNDKSVFLYNKSMAYYNNAIMIMPNAIEPRYGYGFPAYYVEDYTNLITQDKKILEIDPNNKTINGNLGAVYYYAKDYTKALPHFEKVVAMYPFDYDNNLLLAWTYLHLGKNAEAEQCFNVVLLYSPKDISALEGLASLGNKAPANKVILTAFSKNYELTEKTDYKGAINSLKEVYDKSSYITNLRLGWLCNLAGMQAESASYYKIASELMPNAIEPKFGCAISAETMANKVELKAQYEAVIAIDKQNTYAHYKLGLLDYEKKDYEAAKAHFEKITNLYPCNSDALLMLGWTNYQLNKTTESKAFFNKVLCLSPNNSSALQGLNSKPVDQLKKSNGF